MPDGRECIESAAMENVGELISRAMLRDQWGFRRRWEMVRRGGGANAREAEEAELRRQIGMSVALRERRPRGRPAVRFPEMLPVSAKREELAKAIRENQVVVVCGETGSGKTTQLPKICLEMGRGVAGMIGHTQPRRIAARSVAARIAEELGTRVGRGGGVQDSVFGQGVGSDVHQADDGRRAAGGDAGGSVFESV